MFVWLFVRIEGDSYGFEIAESECANKIALSPTNVKGRDSFKKIRL
jgi:hypothetical protein